MEKVTFESLPQAVEELNSKLNRIEDLLQLEKTNKPEWMSLSELIDYDPRRRSKATIYKYVQSGIIPHRRSGKSLIFLKSEIDEWLNGSI